MRKNASLNCAEETSLNGIRMDKIRALRKVDPVKAKKLQRRLKQKQQKQKKSKEESQLVAPSTPCGSSTEATDVETVEDVQYVTPDVEDEVPETLSELKEVMERFLTLESTRGSGRDRGGEPEFDEGIYPEERNDRLGSGRQSHRDDAFADDEDESKEQKREGLSKKKLKKLMRPSVSALKQICSRPEVVESWDTTAPDPPTLVFLKSYRNSVPVPPHWAHKRRYLQAKRGLEKTLFRLPHYIEATRISEIRSAIEQKDAQKTLKQKMRERVRPRHRKMNIDYQVLHDAFFKYATKPLYTRFGDMYFEGKETEMQMRKYVPGKLSERAREALGMSGPFDPTPWLLNMQRYGPPPSYPNLIVPGVNAHIPDGASLGFQAGGWGRPPTLDQLHEWGVAPRFDEVIPSEGVHVEGEISQQSLWGQLQTLESSDEESEEEDTKMEDIDVHGMETPSGLSLGGTSTPVALDPSGLSSVTSASMLLGGLRSTTGMSSVTSGLETPQSVDIRGGLLTGGTPRPYTILDQTKAPAQPGALFASNTIYTMPKDQPGTTPSSAMLGGTATPFGPS